MPTLHTLFRLAAFSLTAIFILFTLTNYLVFELCVYLIGLGHFYISLIYSSRQIKTVINQPFGSLVFVFILLISGSILYSIKFPLVWFFGIHHAFNEVYLLDQTISPKDGLRIKALRTSGVFLHSSVYFFVLRENHDMTYFNPGLLFLIMILAFAAFFISFYKSKQNFNSSEIIDNCAGEVFLILPVVASFFFNIQFLHVVLYHFIFWWFYPLPKIIRSEKKQLLRYLGITTFFLFAFYIWSPLGPVYYDLKGSAFYTHFIHWSYIHITISFALSSANPGWLIRRFQPRTSPARKG